MTNKYLEKLAGIPDYLGPLGGPVERFAEGPMNKAVRHMANNKKTYVTGALAGAAGYALGHAAGKNKYVTKTAEYYLQGSDHTGSALSNIADVTGRGTLGYFGGRSVGKLVGGIGHKMSANKNIRKLGGRAAGGVLGAMWGASSALQDIDKR